MNDADIIQVDTYIYRTPGILCRGRLLHDKIRRAAPAEISLVLQKIRGPPFIGFSDSVPFFFLTGGGERRDESGGKKGSWSPRRSGYRHLVPYKRLESD